MKVKNNKIKINWYRSHIDADVFVKLKKRSNLKGLIQTFAYLALLILTGTSAYFSFGKVDISITLLIIFLHGTFYAFLINGIHEFLHNSVFKTALLNNFFIKIFSILDWHNYIMFKESHLKHHKYTLYPPKDLEVVLPIKITWLDFLKSAIINPWKFIIVLRYTIRLACGKLEGEWENTLFAEQKEKQSKLFRWSRILLLVHISIVSISIFYGLWLIPILTTFAPFYANGLQFLCNNTQHIGMQSNAPDFRLSCRTIILNPFIRFLYWHMNYHIEHHMYPAVPCYNLKELNSAIKQDLPISSIGLYQTWKKINALESSYTLSHDLKKDSIRP